MSNSLSKEEIVLFAKHLQKFDEQTEFSKHIKVLKEDPVVLERSQNTVRYPIPRIAYVREGLDQTGNFSPTTQLTAPITVGEPKSYPFFFTATELNDIFNTEGEEITRAMESMASAVNISILQAAAEQSTIVITRTNSAGQVNGYNDVAVASAAMTRVGIKANDRKISINPDDYIGLSSWISDKETMGDIVKQSYRMNRLGTIAKFETWDQEISLTLEGVPDGTVAEVTGANQNTTPVTLSSEVGVVNADNQTQQLTMTVTNGPVKSGDCFTISGVFETTHIPRTDGSLQKLATTKLKTFRIISVDSGGTGLTTVTISPQIVSNDGVTIAQIQYQNVSAAPADTAPITFLNTNDAPYNIFWSKDALQLLPARLHVDPKYGWNSVTFPTKSGIFVTLTRQGDINNLNTNYRVDARWGFNTMNREQAGILLFNQAAAT